MAQEVLFDIEDSIGTVTLNVPDRRNALSDQMIKELVEIIGAASKNETLRCLILTGAGSAFCAGGSIHDMRDRTGYAAGGPITGWRFMSQVFQSVPKAFFALDIPVIAAVNGPAIGAGCDIAAMCDIRIASPAASFAESFIRLGVISGDGGTWFLTRAVGRSRAAEMTLTGDAIDAATASEWGLVSRVVPAESLMQEAQALARRIARNPPQSIRLAKRLLREAAEKDLHSSLELAAAMQGVLLHTEDQQEAVRAMLEKRPGQFKGS